MQDQSGDLAGVVPQTDAGMRLEHSLLDRLRLEHVFADVVGAGKRLVHFAELECDLGGDVARGVVVQERCARPHRFFRIEHRRQRLVFDLDQVERLFGGVLVDRRDGCHLFADVAHGVDGQRQVVARLRKIAVLDAGKVLPGDDGANARQGFGATRIDAHDPGVRMRASQQLAVQHSGHADVVGILGAAQSLERAVLLGGRLADDVVLVAEWIVHVSSHPLA